MVFIKSKITTIVILSQDVSHKSLSEIMAYDLCIIGAGMFGSAAARHASKNPSLKICLIGPNEPTREELNEREIFSSHYDEGRITRITDVDPVCQILSKQSIQRYRELERLSGIKFYNPVGCLFIATKNGPYHQKILKASEGYVSLVDLSSKEALCNRFPFIHLNENEIALLDDSGAGHISPRKIVAAQKKVAHNQGCVIYEDIATKITQTDDELYKIETEKIQLSILSKRLLIATGSFINTKDFHVLRPLKVKKYKRTVALLKISEDECNRLSLMPSILYNGQTNNEPTEEKSAYILPPIKYPDGYYYLKIGYKGKDFEVEKLEDIKEWYSSKGEKELIDLGTSLLCDLLPGLKYESVLSNTCINCYTESGLPFINRITPTLTVAVAGNGKGAKFSDEVGRLASLLSVTGHWDSEVLKSKFDAVFQK